MNTTESQINLKELVPAALRSKSEGPALGTSKHYEFLTTRDIMDVLSEMGWDAYDGSQTKTKGDPNTTKHMVKFRNENIPSADGVVPEIILTNSHDRTASLRFYIGLFRSVCSNGLVVSLEGYEGLTESLKVRHMGYSFEDVKAHIEAVTGQFGQVFKLVDKFESIEMTEEQETEFAIRAYAVRFPEYVNPKTGKLMYGTIKDSIDIKSLLVPKRTEDEKHNLWICLNKIQERIINGEFMRTGETGHLRQARAISNIRLNMIINKGIWNLANQFANILN